MGILATIRRSNPNNFEPFNILLLYNIQLLYSESKDKLLLHGTRRRHDVVIARTHVEHTEPFLLRRADDGSRSWNLAALLEVVDDAMKDEREDLLFGDLAIEECNVLAVAVLAEVLFIVRPHTELEVARDIGWIVCALTAPFEALLIWQMEVVLNVAQGQQLRLVEDHESLDQEEIDLLVPQLGGNLRIDAHNVLLLLLDLMVLVVVLLVMGVMSRVLLWRILIDPAIGLFVVVRIVLVLLLELLGVVLEVGIRHKVLLWLGSHMAPLDYVRYVVQHLGHVQRGDELEVDGVERLISLMSLVLHGQKVVILRDQTHLANGVRRVPQRRSSQTLEVVVQAVG